VKVPQECVLVHHAPRFAVRASKNTDPGMTRALTGEETEADKCSEPVQCDGCQDWQIDMYLEQTFVLYLSYCEAPGMTADEVFQKWLRNAALIAHAEHMNTCSGYDWGPEEKAWFEENVRGHGWGWESGSGSDDS
jgi:hypothetical protein